MNTHKVMRVKIVIHLIGYNLHWVITYIASNSTNWLLVTQVTQQLTNQLISKSLRQKKKEN